MQRANDNLKELLAEEKIFGPDSSRYQTQEKVLFAIWNENIPVISKTLSR